MSHRVRPTLTRFPTKILYTPLDSTQLLYNHECICPWGGCQRPNIKGRCQTICVEQNFGSCYKLNLQLHAAGTSINKMHLAFNQQVGVGPYRWLIIQVLHLLCFNVFSEHWFRYGVSSLISLLRNAMLTADWVRWLVFIVWCQWKYIRSIRRPPGCTFTSDNKVHLLLLLVLRHIEPRDQLLKKRA